MAPPRKRTGSGKAKEDRDYGDEAIDGESLPESLHQVTRATATSDSASQQDSTTDDRNEAAASAAPAQKRSRKRSNQNRASGKPSRPLSAYNLFFREERQRLLATGEPIEAVFKREVEPSGNVKRPTDKFQTLVKVVSSRWNQLSQENRKKYEALAKVEMSKYQARMREFRVEEHLKAAESIAAVAASDDVGTDTKQSLGIHTSAAAAMATNSSSDQRTTSGTDSGSSSAGAARTTHHHGSGHISESVGTGTQQVSTVANPQAQVRLMQAIVAALPHLMTLLQQSRRMAPPAPPPIAASGGGPLHQQLVTIIATRLNSASMGALMQVLALLDSLERGQSSVTPPSAPTSATTWYPTFNQPARGGQQSGDDHVPTDPGAAAAIYHALRTVLPTASPAPAPMPTTSQDQLQSFLQRMQHHSGLNDSNINQTVLRSEQVDGNDTFMDASEAHPSDESNMVTDGVSDIAGDQQQDDGQQNSLLSSIFSLVSSQQQQQQFQTRSTSEHEDAVPEDGMATAPPRPQNQEHSAHNMLQMLLQQLNNQRASSDKAKSDNQPSQHQS